MNKLNSYGLNNFYFHTTSISLGGVNYSGVRVFNIINDDYNIYYQKINKGSIKKININYIFKIKYIIIE